MDRRAVWPDFRDAWVVSDDGHLLAVDKPVGVSSQAADPDRPDDVVTRLRSHFGGAYLGAHQRLDQATSGLLVYARRKEDNAKLAAQFEGRKVKKTYLACVAGWPKGRAQTAHVTLRDTLVKDKDGTMRVARGRARDGKPAVTHVKVRAQKGDRALLEIVDLGPQAFDTRGFGNVLCACDRERTAGAIEIGGRVANLLIEQRHGVGVGKALDRFRLPSADDGEDGFEHASLRGM